MIRDQRTTGAEKLRTFSKVAFIVLLIMGTFALLGGFAMMDISLDLAASYIISGLLCILGAFAVLYILGVLAGIAEDISAQRAVLERMERAALLRQNSSVGGERSTDRT